MSSKNSDFSSHFGTLAIHAGNEAEKQANNEVVSSLSLSTNFKIHEIKAKSRDEYEYSRCGNPTRDGVQENLAVLEKGKYCKVFPSGMAACAAITNILESGEHVVCTFDVYGGVYHYFEYVAVKKHHIKVDFVDLTNLENLKKVLKPETKMIYFETPSNPVIKLVDIVETVKLCRSISKDIIIVVDNTFMSPVFQNPLTLGADAVVHSLTKYINGHSDVIGGAVITNSKEIDDHLYLMQTVSGSVLSPFDCYLVNRGIKTLHLRMKFHSENALAAAQWLEKNSRIEKVLYPGLPSHPQHEIHKKQTSGMSGMLSFYIKGGLKETKKFLHSLKVITLAVSLGAVESLAELPAIMTHDQLPEEDRIRIGITDNLVRLSVGCEDVRDLIADLDQALTKAFEN
ncbi:hypothetical protein FO519_002250 [Halicephalobus sp. NKZ332]|nr:hypothetical protein FO519_002250 [Halicephalobus sp. NKZ332]